MQHTRFKKSTYLMRPVNVVSQNGTTVTSYTELPGSHVDKFWYAPILDQASFALSGFAVGNSYDIGTSTGSPPNPIRISNLNQTFDKIVDLFGQSKLYNAVLGRLKGTGSSLTADASRCQDLINIIINRFGGTVDLSADGTTMQPQIFVSSTDSVYEYFGNLSINHTSNAAEWILPFYLNVAGQNTYSYYVLALTANGVSGTFKATFLTGSLILPYYPRDTGEVEVKGGDPYPNIPDSDTSGGGGSGTDTSDANPVPMLPSVSAIGTGMCRLYNPTVAQLIDLGAWLWGSGLDLTQLKKIFADPMDVILGCSVFPVSMPTESTPQTIIFGNIDSQISSRVVSSQYMSYDLGQVDITSYYNSYLDFAPYTKMQLFLPFIGMKTINVDEFMSTASVTKKIGVTYSIDLLSGACVAHVYLNVGSTSTLLYEFGGTCNTQIPLNSRDYTATVQSLLGIVGGSAAAGMAAFMLPEAIPAVVGAAGVVGGMVMNAAKNTIASKPTVEHAGGIGGSTGIMGSRKAYLIIERPNLCHPENQEHFTGYPGFLYRTVNQLNGYTKFINFELQNIHATEPELEEIKEWFTVKGVLL